jgi:hypothetical protein
LDILSLFFVGIYIKVSYIKVWNLSIMKKDGTIGEEKYTRGELSQLARRRMIQKHHGDNSKYTRKTKHKNKSYE